MMSWLLVESFNHCGEFNIDAVSVHEYPFIVVLA